MGREAGCEVSAEEVVPELIQGTAGSDEAVEARLDLHVWSHPPYPCQWFVDATHHHAWGVKYRTGDLTPGRAAADAEETKRTRYGPGQGGVCVTPAAMESWGRLGLEFERLSRQLLARWANLIQAGASSLAATGRRWRAELGVAQVRALHVTCMRAVQDPGEGPACDMHACGAQQFVCNRRARHRGRCRVVRVCWCVYS